MWKCDRERRREIRRQIWVAQSERCDACGKPAKFPMTSIRRLPGKTVVVCRNCSETGVGMPPADQPAKADAA